VCSRSREDADVAQFALVQCGNNVLVLFAPQHEIIRAMLDKASKPADAKEPASPVVIKKYANRRLYNTETSSYVTLDDLAAMVRSERDFVVYDAKSGEELTHAVLTQIIMEQESRMGGETMLPIPFLQQLIRFYGGSMQKMVPSYLQFSLATLAKDQEKFVKQFGAAFTPAGAFEAFQEQSRKNVALFEQALTSTMGMFSPFGKGALPSSTASATPPPVRPKAEAPPAEARPAQDTARRTEIDEMKAQMAAMQAMIEKLSKR
jgi:polyhydroxyalkanoate synthesis repressor PhaR